MISILTACSLQEAIASGCFSDSFYNVAIVAKNAGAEVCYYKKLEPISNPESMADRQYNYFSEKLNEYSTVLGIHSFDKASFEFMFYPEIRKNSLASEDARLVDFDYTQRFDCYTAAGETKQVESRIYAYGRVGLTGVCLHKEKQKWF